MVARERGKGMQGSNSARFQSAKGLTVKMHLGETDGFAHVLRKHQQIPGRLLKLSPQKIFKA